MIQIDLPMPKECEFAYSAIIRTGDATHSEVKTWFPCPCYDEELQECQAVVPNRALYDHYKGIDELHENYRPAWCPLKEVK